MSAFATATQWGALDNAAYSTFLEEARIAVLDGLAESVPLFEELKARLTGDPASA